LTAHASNGRVVVGFAAEAGNDGLERARAKRTSKKVDLVVYNGVGATGVGFDAAENEVVIISAEGERHVARAPKERIAAEILDDVEQLLREER
jgi:phosphopantothenoylcysteine decarboxylase / phosphopantothenate---cysteine ligase